MARLDKIHEAVKNALIKDGWTITDDPYSLEYKGQKFLVDLAAERNLVAAEKDGEKIAIEIKSFLSLSKMPDLYSAVGQYGVYRIFLNKLVPERKLFLAISEEVFREFFTSEAISLIVESENISILTINIESEEIARWIR